VQHKETSEFLNPRCVIGGNKNKIKKFKSDSRVFRGSKAGKSAYFTHSDFSAAKLEKKCTNYASKYGNKFREKL
jgi:imidazoleglycerol phosphate synthase glutamine amidotransferase subunit HisH